MILKPVLHRLFIQPENVHQADDIYRRAKAAGLEIAEDKREKKAVTIGTVLAIGSTCYQEFQSTAEREGIKIGSRVVYAKYSGAEVPNETFIILSDEDVIGVYADE